MPHALTIADTKNQETQRKRINALLALYAPGYGPALPDVDDVPDGKIFYESGIGYQKQNGVWVNL